MDRPNKPAADQPQGTDRLPRRAAPNTVPDPGPQCKAAPSGLPGLPARPATADWPELVPVRRHPKLSAAAKLAYTYLWGICGRRPGYLIFTIRFLSYELGRTERAATKWIAELGRWGLLEQIDRDQAGRLHLLLYRPLPDTTQRADRRDPQMMLFPVVLSEGKNPTNPEPPNPNAHCAAHSAAHPTAHSAAHFTAPQSAPPIAESPQNKGSPAPQAHSAAPRSAPLPHGPMEGERLALPLPIDSMVHGHGRARTREAGASAEGSLRPVLGALVEAVNRTTDPATIRQRKAHLVAWLADQVGDPQTDASVFRRAAEAVCDHGLALEVLQEIADATRRKRVDGTIRKTPGAYFVSRLKKACAECGVEIMRRRARRPSEGPNDG